MNHNGGHIAFGPDGYLYVGLGDGMYADVGDPNGRAQDTTDLLGALLRIDVDGGAPYRIPSGPNGNPFAGNPMCPADHSSATACPEIYAWGFRNPWRFSFDRASGRLWLGDVGQDRWEEVNIVQAGGNYGWNCREGASGYEGAGSICATTSGLINPVYQYPRPDGYSVTGGFVYRGTAIAGLIGQYVFGDDITGRIWRLVENGSGGYGAEELASSGLLISTFAEDTDRELYVVGYGGFGSGANGAIYRLAPGSGTGGNAPSQVADRLSATGCVSSTSPASPAQGLIPYEVSAAAWFDGAARERWFAVPDGTTISVDAAGHFGFPPRSVLMEHLRLNGRLIETRLLMHHPGGEWRGYSYEWNTQQSDAVLVSGGKLVDLGTQQWLYATANGCAGCHRASVGYAVGLEIAQLNRAFLYRTTGRTADQLATLDSLGLFTTPVGTPSVLPVLPNPGGASAALRARARAYLHANCAHCHGGGGTALAGLDLRFTTLLNQTGACDVAPQRGNLGLVNPRIIAPGNPDRSVLLARMSRRGDQQMPPLGSLLTDTAGITLVRAWIDSLSSCL